MSRRPLDYAISNNILRNSDCLIISAAFINISLPLPDVGKMSLIVHKRMCFAALAAFSLAATVLLTPPSAADQRGVAVIKDSSGSEVGFYKNSYALLIGVSDYTAGWPDLESIPAELQAVEKILREFGFHVEMHLNADHQKLEDAIQDFINEYGFESGNRLLFFFAGHGETRQGGRKGYLVPADAPVPARDEKGFLQKALPMSQILAWARQIEAGHVLFLFDSCFSGTVFKQRSLPPVPPHISKLTAKPVRQFITAGSAGESVPANSVFTPVFIDGLEHGLADLNKDGYVTGTELGVYLQGNEILRDHQTPQFGKINDYELSRGDFVFPLARIDAPGPKVKNDSKAPSASAINRGDRVLAKWKDKNCLYFGQVIEIKDGKYYIQYDFSGDSWLTKDQVFLHRQPSPDDLEPGTKVFVGLEAGRRWAAARVKENRGGQFLVKLDDKYECNSSKSQHWATVEMLVLRK